jgi:hypothetical protein
MVLAGRLLKKSGQKPPKSLVLAERPLIRYILSGGRDLVNRQGTACA